MAKKAVKNKKESKQGHKKRNIAMIAAVIIAAAVLLVVGFKPLTGKSLLSLFDVFSGPKTAYEKTADKVAKIDEKYGMELDDYLYGMEYLRYHPRYPNPLNPDDIPAVVEEFSEIKKDCLDDGPSVLLVNARIHLLEAEKFYKLAKKFPVKGSVEDGFNCGEIDYVMEAVTNLNNSVMHGRLAVESLGELERDYLNEAESVDVSRYFVKTINETFDEVAQESLKNENVIRYFCMNESSDDSQAYEDEFGRLKDVMKESVPVSAPAR